MTEHNAPYRKLGTTLRAAREERGLSLRAAAEAARMNFGFLGRVEQGFKRPSPEGLKRLARLLKLDAEELAALANGRPLPKLAPYLRAKYDLPAEAVAELERHFAEVSRQYRSGRKGGLS